MTILTAGDLVIDWVALRHGQSLLESGDFYRCLGGNACNVAIGIGRLGSDVRLIAKIGADVDGRYAKAVLSREGVDIGCVIEDARYHTAQCYCMTSEDGSHSFYNWPAPNAAQMLSADDISEAQFSGCAIFHAAGISLTVDPRRQAILKAIDVALSLDIIVCFDAGFPTGDDLEARRTFDKALSSAHILKVNYPELLFWSGGEPSEPPDVLARRLFSRYEPVVLALTLGERGSLLVTSGEEISCPPFVVEEVDAIGAGDGYIAGILHYLAGTMGPRACPEELRKLRRDELLAAGVFGNAVGAIATTRVGSYEGLPGKAEVMSLMTGTVR